MLRRFTRWNRKAISIRIAEYRNDCRHLSSAVIIHVAPDELAKKILQSGTLHALLSQAQNLGELYVSSPEGARDLLVQVEFSLDGIALQYGEKAEFVFRDIQLDSQARFRSLLVTGLTNELDVFGFSFSRAVENRQFFIW